MVTITGEHFSTGAVVKIGGTAATAVIYLSETSLQTTTPAGTAGSADVVVTVGSLSGTLKGGYTYLGAVDCAMTLTVYNHTAGRLGSWTATMPSGAAVTLAIGSLGEVVDDEGNIVQAAISIDSADSQRMVVRKGAVNGRVGEFVGYSTSGSVTFQAPLAEQASYDIFVLNAQNGTDYSVVDSSSLAYNRNTTVSRGGQRRRDRPGRRRRQARAGAVGRGHLPLDELRPRCEVGRGRQIFVIYRRAECRRMRHLHPVDRHALRESRALRGGADRSLRRHAGKRHRDARGRA